jgi:hypothetical protein
LLDSVSVSATQDEAMPIAILHTTMSLDEADSLVS